MTVQELIDILNLHPNKDAKVYITTELTDMDECHVDCTVDRVLARLGDCCDIIVSRKEELEPPMGINND